MTSLWQLKRFEARISLFKSLDCPLALAAAGMNQRFTRYPPVINYNLGWCNWKPWYLQTNCWADLAQIWWMKNYVIPQTSLTFGHALLNSLHFLTSDLSGSSHTFAEKHFSEWAEIWGANSLWDSPGLINFWSCSVLPGTICWPLIWGAASVHLQTNRWSDWLQIWWVNSLWDFQGLIIFTGTD